MRGFLHSNAFKQFVSSMSTIHPASRSAGRYQIELIPEMSPEEIERLTGLLEVRTWREIDALAAIKSPRAFEMISQALQHPHVDVRTFAAITLFNQKKIDDIDDIIAQVIREDAESYRATALKFVQDHPSEKLITSLFLAARHSKVIGAHCAGLLFFLAGLSQETFDWKLRPFFLRFSLPVLSLDREKAYQELCEKVKARLMQ